MQKIFWENINPLNLKTGLSLPVISNQKLNKYIEDLCELCGFNTPIAKVCYRAGTRVEETLPKYELLGTHTGRRPFICFTLSNGVPPQIVMKWTGDSIAKQCGHILLLQKRPKPMRGN